MQDPPPIFHGQRTIVSGQRVPLNQSGEDWNPVNYDARVDLGIARNLVLLKVMINTDKEEHVFLETIVSVIVIMIVVN